MKGGHGIESTLEASYAMVQDDASDEPNPSAPIPARGPAPPPPTPVRASLGDAPVGGTAEPAVPMTEIEVDGTAWSVRVDGKSRSGAALASAPILFLRFERTDGVEGPSREAWAVGRALSDLTEFQVEEAFRKSAPDPGTWTRKPLFPETGSRGGRDG